MSTEMVLQNKYLYAILGLGWESTLTGYGVATHWWQHDLKRVFL